MTITNKPWDTETSHKRDLQVRKGYLILIMTKGKEHDKKSRWKD